MSDAARQRLPEDLELMAPGPQLAALLAGVDRSRLSGKDRLRLAQARNRLVSHQQAELLQDLYAVSLEEPPDGRVTHEQHSRYRWAETEVAFAMRWTRMAAGGRLEQARQLIEDLPQVQAALRQGLVDMPRALVIAELASWLWSEEPDTVRQIVDRVIDKAPQWTTGQLRARLRQLLLVVDPQAATRRCGAAIRTRRVQCLDNPEGTAELWGRSLPPQDAAAAFERLTAIARAAKAAGDQRSVTQLRADALLDLLIGEGIAVGGSLGRHTGGLSEAAGLPPDEQPSPKPQPPAGPVPTEPEQPALAARSAARGLAGDPAGGGWDPSWPAEPYEPIGPHDVDPDPLGPPADRSDGAWHDFDGPELWPPDWPGRWWADPAVAAAAGDPGPGGRPASQLPVQLPGRPPGQPAEPPALPAPRRGVVELQLPLTTAIGLDDLPGQINGFGPVVADIARQVIAELPDAQWRFSVYNKLGELVVHGITNARPAARPSGRDRRRPSAEQTAFVRARDRTCVAPGCRRPARTCDVDHTQSWVSGGHTGISNLGSLCRGHHLFKHTTGCELHQITSGSFVWQTPRGLQYLTKPDAPLLTPRTLAAVPDG